MSTTWEALRSNVDIVRVGWQQFVHGAPQVEGVRLPILHSWERSLAAGVNPGQPGGPLTVSRDRLEDSLRLHMDLLTAAAPVAAELRTLLEGTGQVFVVCDPKARVLLVEGETSAVGAAEKVNLAPGTDWSEPGSGTNAMGMALADRQAVTVFASEHFLENLHAWACVAVPVRHPVTGECLGILDLSGEHMSVNRHTEMAILGAARTIEARLALMESTYRHTLLDAFSEHLARLRYGAAAVVDRFGTLLRAAGSAALSVSDPRVWSRGMTQVLQTGRDWQEECQQQGGHRLHLSYRPVRMGGTIIGALVEVRSVAEGTGRTHHSLPLAVQGLVGSNPAWLAVLDRAARAARTDATALISGETGTGKEVVARAIHRASSRGNGPFVAVNCGALPPTLAVSELFGYTGGAFTGANPKGSPGKVEAASGGTLFLDEVSELSPEAQVLLLRVLQEREVVRLGSHHSTPVNLRVIAATNKNLEGQVSRGLFREDLFFRLAVVPLHLPPLRERREDILPLVEFGYRRLGIDPPDLGLTSCEKLTAYQWPGNVRQLLNLVEQAVALTEDPADLLPMAPLPPPPQVSLGEPGEEEQIRQALDSSGGNAAAAARLLGVSRSTLYRKLEHFGIRLKRQVE